MSGLEALEKHQKGENDHIISPGRVHVQSDVHLKSQSMTKWNDRLYVPSISICERLENEVATICIV